MSTIPTDEMLNAAIAQAIGRSHTPVPDYCSDRNVLPEIWQAVEGEQDEMDLHRVGFGVMLMKMLPQGQTRQIDRWNIATAPPRLHVIAALLSLGAWPAHWRTPELPQVPYVLQAYGGSFASAFSSAVTDALSTPDGPTGFVQ